jgi:hypothetical protein
MEKHGTHVSIATEKCKNELFNECGGGETLIWWPGPPQHMSIPMQVAAPAVPPPTTPQTGWPSAELPSLKSLINLLSDVFIVADGKTWHTCVHNH